MNKDLTVGKPETVLWKFCLPLFGSIVFQQLYNIADSLVAGKFISENALAAVGNSYEITLIFIAFAFGCNMGCSIVVSQLFGAKEYNIFRCFENVFSQGVNVHYERIQSRIQKIARSYDQLYLYEQRDFYPRAYFQLFGRYRQAALFIAHRFESRRRFLHKNKAR